MWGNAAAATPLPTIVEIDPGEALDGYLERVADANYLSTAHLVTLIRNASDTLRYITLAPSPATIAAIAALTGQRPDQIHQATLSAYDHTALDLTGFDPTIRSGHRAVAARGWFPGRGTQICPPCLAHDGRWRLIWRLPTTTVCRVHGVYVLSTCPGCHRPFRDHRHSPLRVVGAETRCGNPLGQGPRKQCTVDLAALPTTPADAACIIRQERHDKAAAGAVTSTALGDLEPADYLATTRSLAVLLLHISTAAPDSSRLPAWAQALRPDAPRRTIRWGIRPPHDPQLRSRALTAADTILTASDLDAAVECLMPWLDSLPDLPESRLGWMADHTRMTPTLTRLVLAGHAPRRRVSHLLDQVPPLTASTRQIPQVLPEHLVETHLIGLFDSRPCTVGLFACLCLARTHPNIDSWAKAAHALGLAPDLGARTARACSASLTGSPREVVAALRAATRGLDVDYRSLEDRVRHLAGTTRWFTRWARTNRPGTRASSHPYAVYWVWTRVAHGHASAAPAAVGSTRALNFERSLTTAQTAALTALVTPTAACPQGFSRWAATTRRTRPSRKERIE